MATGHQLRPTLEARLYESTDAEAVDKILGYPQSGDVRLDRDRIVVVGRPARGLLVWRPGGIVHELRTGYGLAQRRMADLLVGTAMGDAVSRPSDLHEAIFITDSDELANYVLGMKGIVEEIGKRVFTLNLRVK